MFGSAFMESAPAAHAENSDPCPLQAEDVHEGYEVDAPYHETTNEYLIARSSNPGLATAIASTGRITGFEIVYAQPSLDALTYGPIAIQSWKTVFDNLDGAHAVLSASARGEVLQAPEIGEEFIAWKITAQVGSVVFGYAFRRAPDEIGRSGLVGISIGALDGVSDIETVNDLFAMVRARGCS
jgi:hypothetical protein